MSQGASGGHRWRSSVGIASTHGSSLKAKQVVWTALAVLLGAVSLWLLAKFVGVGKPLRSQIVSIGMTYDNPVFRPTPFLLDSTRAFDELLQRNESKHQFVESSYPPGTKLDGPEVLEIISGLSLNSRKENLLVYLNLQGGVIEQTGDAKGAAACFLTLRAGPNSLPEGAGGQRVLVQDLLKACGQASAANVIVLLEAGDCGPNWRAGILNRDFVAQLKKEVAQAVQEFPKLRVIGAVSEGESAQASRRFGDGASRSAFSHFAVQGLLGEADDWKFDSDTGKSARGDARQRQVRTVSFDELFAYLHEQVGTWSKSHRAVSQTVWRFPESGSVLELAQIDSGRVRSAKPAKEVAADAKSAGKEGTEKSREKDSPSVLKDSPKDTPSEKTDEKKSADTAEPDSSKKPAAEGTKVAQPGDKPGADKAEVEVTPAARRSEDIEKLRTQLVALWTRRDLARQEGLAVQIAPREWRRLQLELVRVEQGLRDGDALDRVEKDLLKGEGSLRKIVEQVQLIKTQRQRPADELVSLAFVGSTGSPSPNELSADEQKQFDELLKLAFPNGVAPSPPKATPQPVLPATAPDTKTVTPVSEPPKHDELRKLLGKYPHLRGRVWNEALQPILKFARSAKGDDRVLAVEFVQGKSAILLAESLTKDLAGRSLLPAEAVTILGVITVAEETAKEQIIWTPDLRRACGHLIDLRERFEQFAAREIVFSALLRPSFAEAEVQLMTAERWVQVGQADRAVQTLGQVETALASARKVAETLRRAAALKANIAAELPDLARWVARQQEASGKDSIKSTREALYGFAKSEKSLEKEASEELSELRKFAQDESWFGLFDVIEQTTELFRLTAIDVPPTADQSRPTAPSDPARLQEITDLTNRLEQSWNDWRSLDREVETLLSATTPPVEYWTRLQDVLLVPWIPADKRQRLLKQLDLLDQPNAASGSAEIRKSVVRGDWQAFWAIETLRLAGLDAESEQVLWDKFAKSLKTSTEGDDMTESYAASAALGQEIARKFDKLARNADSAATVKAARHDEIDLARGEQLTRGVDPADPAAPGTQAEFSLASRLSGDHNEFVQVRAKQAARNARLGGNVMAAHWAALAERWTKLCNPASKIAPDESPFTLDTISNEQLFWPPGDPAVIKLSLIATPRPGMKRSETMIRVLDADPLKVEPQKLTQSEGYDLEVSDASQEIALTIQKPKSVTATESVITIVLLDKATQLPWDVRRLALRTPLKDQDWRIEFRAKEELADRNHSAALDRNKGVQSPDKYRTVLWLPAKPRGAEPMSLQPVLIPPPDSKISSVSVRVFELDEKGQPRLTPSGKQDNIPMNRDGRPIALNLAAAPVAVAPPAAAATNPKPTVAPEPKGKEVSRGWVFEILPAGEQQPIKQQVIPRVRPPQTYFDPANVQVTFRDGELKFELQRRTDAEERDLALRPKTVRVKLELPKALDALRTDNDLLLNLERGEKKHLVARLNEQRLAMSPDESFVVTVNVGGWPRAFPYQIRHGKPSVEYPPTRPVIVAPAAGSVIAVGEKLAVDVQIDSGRLNSYGLDEPWKLVCELVSTTESDITRRPDPIEIFRSLQESIELVSQGETEWLLTAEVRNHRVEFETEGLRGRFTVRATAAPSGNTGIPPGSGDSDRVLIAIAEPMHKPPTPKLTVATLAKIRPGTESDWLVPVSAADPEAGIVEIAAGFDLDKDGKLGDAEIFKETTKTWTNPLDQDERRETLRITAARLQDKQTGKHKLLVRSKNGVGQVCEDPLPVLLEVDQARGWVVVKVANFDQKGCVLFVDGIKQPGAAKREMSFELPIDVHEFQLANDIVDTRRGGLKKVVVKPEHTKDNPVTVTLEPPVQ